MRLGLVEVLQHLLGDLADFLFGDTALLDLLDLGVDKRFEMLSLVRITVEGHCHGVNLLRPLGSLAAYAHAIGAAFLLTDILGVTEIQDAPQHVVAIHVVQVVRHFLAEACNHERLRRFHLDWDYLLHDTLRSSYASVCPLFSLL